MVELGNRRGLWRLEIVSKGEVRESCVASGYVDFGFYGGFGLRSCMICIILESVFFGCRVVVGFCWGGEMFVVRRVEMGKWVALGYLVGRVDRFC